MPAKPPAMEHPSRLTFGDLPETDDPFAFFAHRGSPNLGSVGGDLQMLMYRMQGADQAPTAADLAALDKTSAELKSLMNRWDALKGQPLADLNRALQKSGQPPLALAKALAPIDWNAGWITTNRDQEEK